MPLQEHVHALKTDHHLVVKGSGGTIFALGDAATIQQDKALDHAAELFRRVHAALVHGLLFSPCAAQC